MPLSDKSMGSARSVCCCTGARADPSENIESPLGLYEVGACGKEYPSTYCGRDSTKQLSIAVRRERALSKVVVFLSFA